MSVEKKIKELCKEIGYTRHMLTQQIERLEENLENYKKENEKLLFFIFMNSKEEITKDIFFDICKNKPEKIEMLLEYNQVTREVFNSLDENGKSCLNYVLSSKNNDYIKILLESDLLEQELFDSFAINGIGNEETINILLKSRFMTINKFNEFDLRYISVETLEILVNSEFMTLEKFNTFDNNIFDFDYIKVLLESKFMTIDKFNEYNLSEVKNFDIFKLLLESDFMTQDKFDSSPFIFEKNKSNKDKLDLVLNSKFITQEYFNNINIYESYSDSIYLLMSKFMTQENFDKINLNKLLSGNYDVNYNVNSSRGRNISKNIVLHIIQNNIKTNGNWVLTKEKFNTINFLELCHKRGYPGRRYSNGCGYFCTFSINSIYTHKFLTKESFEKFSIDILSSYNFIRSSHVDFVLQHILKNRYLTKEFFDTVFTNFVKTRGNQNIYTSCNSSLYRRTPGREFLSIETRKNIISHKFVNFDLFDNSIQDLICNCSIKLILEHKFMKKLDLINRKVIVEESINRYELKPFIDIIKKEHLELPFFIINLDNKELDYIYDKYHNFGITNRLICGNKYYAKRNKCIKAIETISEFMYDCYFGPSGVFFNKQLEKIDD